MFEQLLKLCAIEFVPVVLLNKSIKLGDKSSCTDFDLSNILVGSFYFEKPFDCVISRRQERSLGAGWDPAGNL